MENITFESLKDFMINSGWKYEQNVIPKFGSKCAWDHVFELGDKCFFSDSCNDFFSGQSDGRFTLSEVYDFVKGCIPNSQKVIFTGEIFPVGVERFTSYEVLIDKSTSKNVVIKVGEEEISFNPDFFEVSRMAHVENNYDPSKFSEGDVMLEISSNGNFEVIKVTDVGVVFKFNDYYFSRPYPDRGDYLKVGEKIKVFSYTNILFLTYLDYQEDGIHRFETISDESNHYHRLKGDKIEFLPSDFSFNDILHKFVFISETLINFLEDDCKIELGALRTIEGIRNYRVLNSHSTPEYNFYDFSSNDLSRVSGLSKNKFRGKNWKEISEILEFRATNCTFNRISKLLSLIGIKDNEIVKLVSTKLSVRNEKFSINNVKESKNVTSIYNMDHGDRGNISSSCMRGCDYFELYDKAAKDGDLIISYITEGDVLKARALIWNKVTLDNGKKISLMDRIYSANDFYERLMKDYAISKGHYIKKEQSAHNRYDIVSPLGIHERHSMEITLDFCVSELSSTPYVDTFCMTDGGGFISNDSGDYDLQDTSGDNPCNCTNYDHSCDRCGYEFDEGEDTVHTDNYVYCCSDCAVDDNCFYCDHCNEWHDSSSERYVVQGTDLCQVGYEYHDCFYCDHCDDNFYGDNLGSCEDAVLCQDCYGQVLEEEDESKEGKLKFKVGDKVVALRSKSGVCVEGETGFILKVDPDDRSLTYQVGFNSSNDYWFSEPSIKLFEEPQTEESSIFKVGDEVRVIKVSTGYSHYYSIGASETICEVYPDLSSTERYRVLFTGGNYSPNLGGNYSPNLGGKWWVNNRDIELIPQHPQVTLTNIDDVDIPF